jgi:hypothetical protein
VDSWSLGCVLSIAATWVVLGYQGIMQFEILRRDAIKRMNKNIDHKSNIEVRDAFHNGDKVMDEVTTWHKYLRDHIRVSDKITPLVLDLLDERLFVADPKERATTVELCEKLDAILHSVKATANPGLPEVISQSLQKTDKKAAARPIYEAMEKLADKLEKLQRSGATSPVAVAESRSSTANKIPLMKTTNRTRSGLSAQERSADGAVQSPVEPTISTPKKEDSKVIQTEQANPPRAARTSDASLHTSVSQGSIPQLKSQNGRTYTNLSSQSSPITNHLQAHEERGKSWIRRKEKPDKQLEHWFKGRDVVSLLVVSTRWFLIKLRSFCWITAYP